MSSVEQHASSRGYWIGYVLALVLTAGAFGLVVTGLLPRPQALLTIGVLAVLQTVVHLRFFLHINSKSTPVEMLVSGLFALVLVLIMIGGSLWIMTDLDARMGM